MRYLTLVGLACLTACGGGAENDEAEPQPSPPRGTTMAVTCARTCSDGTEDAVSYSVCTMDGTSEASCAARETTDCETPDPPMGGGIGVGDCDPVIACTCACTSGTAQSCDYPRAP